LQIIESAGEGGVDPFAVESQLNEEARLRLREIVVDDAPIDGERAKDRVLDDLIGWFDRRRMDARRRDLNRRLRDPDADDAALLAEGDALLLERRARLGLGSSGNTQASDGAD